ncbi:hypothetical protein AB3K25_09880 [Leuconostoc sp. MS02]|uniref:Bacteriocin immunity protein n=1 Tax=Leuconostoc aquikimchii TaxID=3236804 RepID=A0ABV3S063_9LACO
MKKSIDTLSFLNSVSLSDKQEREYLDVAIEQLNKHQNEHNVLSELQFNLTQLAIKQKISKDGLAFLMQLNKPNMGVDYGRASMTWF